MRGACRGERCPSKATRHQPSGRCIAAATARSGCGRQRPADSLRRTCLTHTRCCRTMRLAASARHFEQADRDGVDAEESPRRYLIINVKGQKPWRAALSCGGGQAAATAVRSAPCWPGMEMQFQALIQWEHCCHLMLSRCFHQIHRIDRSQGWGHCKAAQQWLRLAAAAPCWRL